MLESSEPLKIVEHGSWSLRFFRKAPSGAGSRVEVAVEMIQGGEALGQLASARMGLPVQAILALLERRALAWINDYDERRGLESTVFGGS